MKCDCWSGTNAMSLLPPRFVDQAALECPFQLCALLVARWSGARRAPQPQAVSTEVEEHIVRLRKNPDQTRLRCSDDCATSTRLGPNSWPLMHLVRPSAPAARRLT